MSLSHSLSIYIYSIYIYIYITYLIPSLYMGVFLNCYWSQTGPRFHQGRKLVAPTSRPRAKDEPPTSRPYDPPSSRGRTAYEPPTSQGRATDGPPTTRLRAVMATPQACQTRVKMQGLSTRPSNTQCFSSMNQDLGENFSQECTEINGLDLHLQHGV